MKTLLSLTLFLCTVTGFAQLQSLEARVIEIAKADKNYYEPGTTRIIKEVMIQDSERNFFKDIEAEAVALPEALEQTNKIIAQATQSNDTGTLQVWNFKKVRLEKFMKAGKRDIDYKIVEHNFTFRNPQKGYTISKGTSYYFFDGNDGYIGFVDSKTFDDCTINFDKSETQRYEAMMFEVKH